MGGTHVGALWEGLAEELDSNEALTEAQTMIVQRMGPKSTARLRGRRVCCWCPLII